MGRSRARSVRSILLLTPILVASLSLPGELVGQTAQPFSAQMSAITVYPFAGGLTLVSLGLGIEAQARWTPGHLSVGAGVERSFHEVIDLPGREIVLTGVFVEPRWVITDGNGRFGPYASLRLAISHTRAQLGWLRADAVGFTINGGGGTLVQISPRINLDAGATFGLKDLGSFSGPSGVQSLGSGGNFVVRVGVVVGLG